MKFDSMDIEILPNGDIKVTTSKISPANHMGAEDLVKFMAQKAGGKTVRQRRGKAEAHHHGHSHEHAGH